MRKFLCLLLPLLIAAVLHAQLPSDADTITQFSTYASLSVGNYDGTVRAQDIMSKGKLGIGTFDGLDGEMIILDGDLFQVTENGEAKYGDPSAKVPFAILGTIKSDKFIKVAPETTMEEFVRNLEKRISSVNTMCVVRLEGMFKQVQTRSVARQKKPYLPLETVVAAQKVKYIFKQHGVMVGFYMPSLLRDVVAPGLHLHFIASDRKKGGHVVDFIVDKASMIVEEKSEFDLILPDSEAFQKTDFSKLAAASMAKPAPAEPKKDAAPAKNADVIEAPPPPPPPPAPKPAKRKPAAEAEGDKEEPGTEKEAPAVEPANTAPAAEPAKAAPAKAPAAEKPAAPAADPAKATQPAKQDPNAAKPAAK